MCVDDAYSGTVAWEQQKEVFLTAWCYACALCKMSARSESLKRTGSAVLEPRPDPAALKREVRAAFSKYDKAGDGFIDEADLSDFITDLQGKKPTKSEVLFVLRGIDASGDGRISFDELYDYWVKAKAGHKGGKLNKLLVRDKVGAVRVSSYDLPPVEHSFGMKNAEQLIGAKEGALGLFRCAVPFLRKVAGFARCPLSGMA